MTPHTICWPPGTPRVLVTDCWMTNAGDAAIALAIQRLLERHVPGASVLHAAYESPHVIHHYPELRVLPPLEGLVGTTWAEPWDPAGPRLVRDADLIVSQGGGFFRAGYRPWGRVDALGRTADTERPLLMLGQTFGRFEHAFARRALGKALRHASSIVVRDPQSIDHAIDLGAPSDLTVLGGDFALALLGPLPQATDPDWPISVVLTVNSNPDRADDLTSNAAELLERVAECAARSGLRVRVWSSAQSAGREDDGRLIAEVSARLPESLLRHVDVIADHVPALRVVELARQSAAMVSMRFHPALLAAAQGTPTMLVMSDQRAETFEGTALASWTVDPHSDCLGDRVITLLESLEVRWDESAVRAPMLPGLAVTERALVDGLRQVAGAGELA